LVPLQWNNGVITLGATPLSTSSPASANGDAVGNHGNIPSPPSAPGSKDMLPAVKWLVARDNKWSPLEGANGANGTVLSGFLTGFCNSAAIGLQFPLLLGCNSRCYWILQLLS
jgi:hypothetical protein